ncbi:MAG: type II toxin-antitoxin system VapC family toxin [Terracidiphilus sp.]
MVAADTNVWARALLDDDALHSPRARNALIGARSKGGVFVPLIVMAELAWVLRSKWERGRVLASLEDFLHAEGVTVESPSIVEEAIEASRSGKGGFADQLIAKVGYANGAFQVITLDQKFARSANVRLLR